MQSVLNKTLEQLLDSVVCQMQFHQLMHMHKQEEPVETIRQQKHGGGMAGITERSEHGVNQLNGNCLYFCLEIL